MNVAVDPGVSTGIAARLPDGTVLTGTYTTQEMWEFFRRWGPLMQHVAVEIFKRSNRIDPNMILTMENVGGVKAMCAMFPNVKKLWLHDNQSRKSFLSEADGLLRAKGERYTEHEKDALAHLLLLEYDLRLQELGKRR